MSVRLPSGGRLVAILLFTALVAGTVALVNGPWLRVVQVAHAGARNTPVADLEALLAGYASRPILALDTAGVEARLRELPSVAEAHVSTRLPGTLAVEIVEKQPAATWLTAAARLVLAADGTVIATLPLGYELPAELASLPTVEDQRGESRQLAVGGSVPASELEIARRLLDLDPRLVGSQNRAFGVAIQEEYGFVLLASRPEWRAALGFYQEAPGETAEVAAARLDAQVAALRTLFAERREIGVGWVDARNPGKVYWAP